MVGVNNIRMVLATRTTEAALILREFLGEIYLTPETPEVGHPYFVVKTNLRTFTLLRSPGLKEDAGAKGSNSDRWWT